MGNTHGITKTSRIALVFTAPGINDIISKLITIVERTKKRVRLSRKLNYGASPHLIKKSVHIFAFQDWAAQPSYDKVKA